MRTELVARWGLSRMHLPGSGKCHKRRLPVVAGVIRVVKSAGREEMMASGYSQYGVSWPNDRITASDTLERARDPNAFTGLMHASTFRYADTGGGQMIRRRHFPAIAGRPAPSSCAECRRFHVNLVGASLACPYTLRLIQKRSRTASLDRRSGKLGATDLRSTDLRAKPQPSVR
jgi:hypothetical protein